MRLRPPSSCHALLELSQSVALCLPHCDCASACPTTHAAQRRECSSDMHSGCCICLRTGLAVHLQPCCNRRSHLPLLCLSDDACATVAAATLSQSTHRANHACEAVVVFDLRSIPHSDLHSLSLLTNSKMVRSPLLLSSLLVALVALCVVACLPGAVATRVTARHHKHSHEAVHPPAAPSRPQGAPLAEAKSFQAASDCSGNECLRFAHTADPAPVNTIATFQIVANPAYLPEVDPVMAAAVPHRVAELDAERVRFSLWFPYPRMTVPQLYQPTEGSQCMDVGTGFNMSLWCADGGKIASIPFASYGLPNGVQCGAYTEGACTFPDIQARVEALCVGQEKCHIRVPQDLYPSGVPTTPPACVGSEGSLHLMVQQICDVPQNYSYCQHKPQTSIATSIV